MSIERFFLLPVSLVLLITIESCAAYATVNYTNETHSQGSLQKPTRTSFATLPDLSTSNLLDHTVTGLADASHCWDEWDAYSSWSTHCPKATSRGSVYTISDQWTYTEYKTFKLCDGHPRAVAQGGWRTSLSTASDITYPFQTVTLTTYTYDFPPSGIPITTVTTTEVSATTEMDVTCAKASAEPECAIDDGDCKKLFSAWTAGGFARSKPPCYYAMPTRPCDDCALFVPTVKLLYFPVSMTGAFCGGDYHTATPTHNRSLSTPSTILWSGTTLTSGSVYLSYAGVTAIANGGTTCGPTKPHGILPLPSSSIFSYRGHAAAMPIAGDHQWPFDFADLAPNPVPWNAWISQDLCYNHQDSPSCATITQAAYRPWLVYPREFFEMEAEWKKCGSGAFGIMDPPTALPKAEALVVPTMSTTAGASESASVKAGASGSPQTPAPSVQVTSESAPLITDPPRITTQTGQLKPEDPITGDPDGSNVMSPDSKSDEVSDPADPGSATTLKSQAGTTIKVADSALRHSRLSIGTLLIAPAAQTGALSIGTHLLSQGEATRLGNTYISIGTRSVVVSVEHTSTTVAPQSLNALSVLSAAQTQNRPWAAVTVKGQTLTVYSAGVVIGPETTYAPGHSQITISSQVINFISEGVVVGKSSTVVFTVPHQTVGAQVPVLVQHGTSRKTVTGTVDSSGSTIVAIGRGMITLADQTTEIDGTTFCAAPSSRASISPIPGSGTIAVSSLPDITTQPHSFQYTTLPPIVDSPSGQASSASGAVKSSVSGAMRIEFGGYIGHMVVFVGAAIWSAT